MNARNSKLGIDSDDVRNESKLWRLDSWLAVVNDDIEAHEARIRDRKASGFDVSREKVSLSYQNVLRLQIMERIDKLEGDHDCEYYQRYHDYVKQANELIHNKAALFASS